MSWDEAILPEYGNCYRPDWRLRGTIRRFSRIDQFGKMGNGAWPVTEPALHSPPVYRWFLGGGLDELRLSPSAAGLVVGYGGALVALRLAVSSSATAAEWVIAAASLVAAIFVALLIAALSARWLGSRPAVLAALVYITSLEVLGAPGRPSMVGTLFCASVAAALGAFALANVPGRWPLRQEPWIAWAFYAAAGMSFAVAGPVGPAFVLAVCLLFLVTSQDPRGLRFFASFTGIAIFLLIATAGLPAARIAGVTCWDGSWVSLLGPLGGRSIAGQPFWTLMGEIPTRMMPWTPFVVLAVIGGLRQGHTSTPIWRFFACWTLGPLVLVAIGAARDPLLLGALLPPLAVIGAAGLLATLHWVRRRRGLLSRKRRSC